MEKKRKIEEAKSLKHGKVENETNFVRLSNSMISLCYSPKSGIYLVVVTCHVNKPMGTT